MARIRPRGPTHSCVPARVLTRRTIDGSKLGAVRAGIGAVIPEYHPGAEAATDRIRRSCATRHVPPRGTPACWVACHRSRRVTHGPMTMPLPGRAAMFLLFDVVEDAIPEHDAWHTHEHLPERLAIPGFVRGTRWVASHGQPRYFVMYEVESWRR